MNKDCTLLLSTYDGGEDLWEGFFKAFSAQWPNFDMPVVLNTESKSFAYPGFDIKTFNLYKPGQKVAWAKRLIETLKRIDTEYILLFLEDFWLEEPVDVEFFEQTLQWMRENEDVACFSYQRVKTGTIQDNRFERFEKRTQDGEYRMNCQSNLWRRKSLIKFLRSHENPWEWEKYGSRRSKRHNDALYSLIDGEKKVFTYDLGGVLYKGRWCKRVVLPLAEKYSLDIDFSKRGFHEDWLEKKEPRKRNIWRGIKNRINAIRSLL